MFIIQATSRITGIITFFSGLIIEQANNTYKIQPEWTLERRFATTFRKEGLADKIADTFRSNSNTVVFSVEYEG